MMKKLWKVLGIATLAAAVVPCRITQDKETGKKKFQSLLISVDIGPAKNKQGTSVGINLGDGVLNHLIMGSAKTKESDMFTDDPQEAVLFADDDPEAAVVEPTPTETAAPAESESVQATEEDFDSEI